MTEAEQQVAAANERHARQLIEAASYLSHDPIDQVAMLLTAATAILEKQRGPAQAAQDLDALLSPTMASWLMAGSEGARQ